MDKQLSKKLNDCGVKKSVIETLLKMPKNSLAGMMNGTRPTPEKWANKLQVFLDRPRSEPEKLFDQMQDAFKKTSEGRTIQVFSDTPLSIDEEKTLSDTFSKQDSKTVTVHTPLPTWALILKEYCDLVNITPEQFIEDHKRLVAGKTIKLQSKAVETVVKKGKEYNPDDNWRYKSKMGDKKQS